MIFWKVNGAKPKKKLQDLLIMYIEKKSVRERERELGVNLYGV